MILPDVNVLIYAHREEMPRHGPARAWLDGNIAGDGAYGMSDLVLSSFIRIVTNPRAFVDPTPLDLALAAAELA